MELGFVIGSEHGMLTSLTVALGEHLCFVFLPCHLVQEPEFCSWLQSCTEITNRFAIFNAKYTSHFFGFSCLEKEGNATFPHRSSGRCWDINYLYKDLNQWIARQKQKGKKTNYLAQKALLRLLSRCFYNINYKSNFTAWWLKGHGCMEQLLKWTKSRFSHGGQFKYITQAMQSCGVEEGTEQFAPGSKLSSKRRVAGLQSESQSLMLAFKGGEHWGNLINYLLSLAYSIQQMLITVHLFSDTKIIGSTLLALKEG